MFALAARPVAVRAESAASPARLTAAQIMQRVRQHARMQTEQIQHYESTRKYAVTYRGFPKSLAATMTVQVSFDANSGKKFRIVSQSGSALLADKVLKRAVESEAEASHQPRKTELSEANYRFQLLGSDSVNGRPAYIVRLDPVRPGKFLSKGKIWIDAAKFAVERMEVQPAKNPSFWISRTRILEVYAPVEGDWLPQSNRSETKVRFGGTAVFTIAYGTYKITPR